MWTWAAAPRPISGRSLLSAPVSPWSGARRTTPAGPAGWRSAAAGARCTLLPRARPVSLLVGVGRHRHLRPAGLGRPPRLGAPGRARRPRRHSAARGPVSRADDPGPLRGAPDAHPRPGARRGRRPRPRLGAAHPHPDPAQRRGRAARCAASPAPRSATCAPGSTSPRAPARTRTTSPPPSPRRCEAQRRRGGGQARRPHRGRGRRRLPARRADSAPRCRPRARRW